MSLCRPCASHSGHDGEDSGQESCPHGVPRAPGETSTEQRTTDVGLLLELGDCSRDMASTLRTRLREDNGTRETGHSSRAEAAAGTEGQELTRWEETAQGQSVYQAPSIPGAKTPMRWQLRTRRAGPFWSVSVLSGFRHHLKSMRQTLKRFAREADMI